MGTLWLIIQKKIINYIDLLLHHSLILSFIWIYILNNCIFLKCIKFNNFYPIFWVDIKITIIKNLKIILTSLCNNKKQINLKFENNFK